MLPVQKLKYFAVSLNQTPTDFEGNIQRIAEALNEIKLQHQGQRLICFPELSLTGYGCEDLFLYPWFLEKTLLWLEKVKKLSDRETAFLIGFPIHFQRKTYNAAGLFHNGKLKSVYCKQFLAIDGVHYEERWFSAWPEGVTSELSINGELVAIGSVTTEVFGKIIGFEICEDAWRGKERPAYWAKKKGVDVVLCPNASHFSFSKHLKREAISIEGSAIIEGTFIYANLLGNEAGRMIYDGDTLIAHKGKLMAVGERLSFKDYEITSWEVGSGPSVFINQKDYSQEDQFQDFLNAAGLALTDYQRKSRTKGFVLSLSGGADSSCCAVLVHYGFHKAFGTFGSLEFSKRYRVEPEFVNYLSCAYQGTENSSEDTYQSAKELAHSLGARFYDWKVDSSIKAIEKEMEDVLGRNLSWKTDDLAKQNVQARVRAPFIWMLTNLKQALLISTSNRSEANVGYATMDGDTAGSISPIAGVSKPFIIDFLRFAENSLGLRGLHWVNNLEPTAELRPKEFTQTDEKDLMPYPVLEAIERLWIVEKIPPTEVPIKIAERFQINDKLANFYCNKYFRLWHQNQWKRERYAPSFHYDDLNVDPRSYFRFPILSTPLLS